MRSRDSRGLRRRERRLQPVRGIVAGGDAKTLGLTLPASLSPRATVVE